MMNVMEDFLRRNAARRAMATGALALALLAGGCASAVAPASSPSGPVAATAAVERPAVFPGEEWERIERPEEVGFSSVALEEVRTVLSDMPSTGLMAVVGGRSLFEHGDLEAVSYLASVRKSILSMLYGIYVDRGVIRLDRTLAEVGIDDHQGLTDREKQATVHDLIAARSGIYHPASNSGDNLSDAPPRGSQAPGSYYLYSNWDFNAAGTVFEKESGLNIFDAVEQHLAVPLGMRDFDRDRHEKGGNLERSMHPSYHMHLSLRDKARIGYLMLREGNWDGEQIVPSDWVRRSTSVITPRSEMNPASRRDGDFGYGYMWWVFDTPELPDAYDGAYAAHGAVGQHILVVPQLDLVIVHKTQSRDGRVSHPEFHRVARMVVDAYCGQSCAAAP